MPNAFALTPPIEPMLAKLADEIPPAGDFLYEPKWDGFRAIVFRGAEDVFIQSRDLRPLDRYFPELHEQFLERLPAGCVLDGEIVIATPRRARLRCAADAPASGRVARRRSWRRRARRRSSAFDLLAVDGRDMREHAAGRAARRGSSGCSPASARRCT